MAVGKNVEDIQLEQDYFDNAMDVHRAKIEHRDGSYGSVATAADRRALKTGYDKLTPLGEDSAVAFARMTLEDGRTHYIGNTLISDNQEILVINWRTRVASRYYESSPEDPMSVSWKRAFDTRGNRIESLQDTLLAELREKIEKLPGKVHVDDALLNSLSSSRDGTMRDIVRTIQAAQNKILRTDKDTLLVVQGGPGTGKTAVALHRASWLLYQYQDSLRPEELMVVGPNPAFTKYIKDVLPGLGDQHVVQTSIQQMLQRDLKVRGIETDYVARLKGSAEMADVIAEGLNDRIKRPTGPLRIRRRNSASTINLLPETVTEDIESLRGEYYGIGREKLKERIIEHCAAELAGVRGDAALIVDPRSVDSEVNKLWPQLSATQYVRELFGSKIRLTSAGGKHLDASSIEALYRPVAERISDEPWTVADLGLIDEAASNINPRQDEWEHIVVDEAQDLSPMQIFALRRRSKNGSMTLVGDIAQSTGPFARNSWSDIIDGIRMNAPVHEATLEHGYRVPREVYAIAQELLPQAAPDIKAPTIVREAQAEPELFVVAHTQVANEVAQVASHHSAKGRFVGVIAPAEQWDAITAAFDGLELQWTDSSTGGLGRSINLVTPESSKGLEFDAVVVVAPQTILEQDNGARLLYIALTRTTSRLDVIAPSGEIPAIIGDAFKHVTVIDEPELEEYEDVEETEPDPGFGGLDDELTITASSRASTPSPTPADIQAQMNFGKPFPRSRSQATNESLETESIELNKWEEDLVERNAGYLLETLQGFYQLRLQRRIVEEVLKRL
ncbi:HelD family protein [Nesterenkonia sandarakina]|uniref:DNA helicase IV n=1 Tax=Nesterenkonia sandarakina TaxID=272918 RepID=A0A2T0YKE5_9MICC|nr:UvrD-helicase domain-containing protein [Nesterenkonia sandarakina]PRZ15593.1 DNA helicase IV [Nesterenkonia sandarakina]